MRCDSACEHVAKNATIAENRIDWVDQKIVGEGAKERQPGIKHVEDFK